MTNSRFGRPSALKAVGHFFASIARSAKTHGVDRSNTYLTALTLGRSDRPRKKEEDGI